MIFWSSETVFVDRSRILQGYNSLVLPYYVHDRSWRSECYYDGGASTEEANIWFGLAQRNHEWRRVVVEKQSWHFKLLQVAGFLDHKHAVDVFLRMLSAKKPWKLSDKTCHTHENRVNYDADLLARLTNALSTLKSPVDRMSVQNDLFALSQVEHAV